MAKKSASQFKVAKPVEDFPPQPVDVEADFNENWEYELEVIKQQLVCVERIDFIYQLVKDWYTYIDCSMDYNNPEVIKEFMEARNSAIDFFKEIEERIKCFSFEVFCEDEFVDPFEDLKDETNVDKVEVKSIFDLWWLEKEWEFLRPFAEHAISLHTRVKELLKENEALA